VFIVLGHLKYYKTNDHTTVRLTGKERSINRSKHHNPQSRPQEERMERQQAISCVGRDNSECAHDSFFFALYHAPAESQLASTRPGGVACLREENLDVAPGMPNCAPFKTTNGATVTTPSSDGAGDGVEEAGSTAASSITLTPALLFACSVALAGRTAGIPGNSALASLNFVGFGDLNTTTSYTTERAEGEEV
jgi:hypothetical protein